MNGDGGLIALSLDDADRLIGWFNDAVAWGERDSDAQDVDLWNRIHEWRARHSEATP